MKRICFFFVVAIACCSMLSGCSDKTTFPYSDINTPIERVELLQHPWYADSSSGEMGNFIFIEYLEDDEIAPFMEALYTLPVFEAKFGEPPIGYGEYVARVCYSDGRILYLGSIHVELVEAGEIPDIASIYSFDGEAFNKLFESYLG